MSYTVKFHYARGQKPLVFENVSNVIPQKGDNSVMMTLERFTQAQVTVPLNGCLYYTKFRTGEHEKAISDRTLPE